MPDPPTPRPAATVILLRRGGKHADRALEVLLVQRNLEARFMPGVWVFPGGAVGDDDAAAAAATRGDFSRGLDEDELVHRTCAVRELEEEAAIAIPASEVLPWSRWITPEEVPIRFDTRFYLALAPAHSPPQPDGAETVAARWFEPGAALDQHRAGGLELVFPTIKHLESLLPYATATEALEAIVDLPPTPVVPQVVGEGDERRVVLPGEAGYEA